MQQYEVQFIESEEEAKVISDQIFNKIAEMGVKDEKSQKEAINQIFNKLFDNLNLAASTPASKFMTTLILRDIIQSGLQPETKLSKLFTVLLSHKLFKHLQFICDTIDPFKIVNEKGKAQFSSDPISGNNLMRCALEIVKFLAYKFPKSKNEEPTAFKRSYNKLIEKKVVFPSDYKYITIALVVPKGGSKDQNGVSSRDKRVSAEMAPPKQKPQNNRENEFNFLCNRLKTFMQTLEEEDEEEQLLKEINKMHGIIKIELPKINNMAAQVTDTADAEFVNRFFDVVGLMEVQQDLYQRFIDHNRDLRNYVQQLKRAGQKVFPSSTNSKVTPGKNDNGKNDQKDKSRLRKTDSIYVQPPPEQRMNKIQATEPKEMASANELKQISKYFLKIEERSKSPINGGFKKIGQSLSRQKSKNSTIRSKVSPLNKSNFNKSINSLKQSKVAAIFTNPPNVNPPSRHYEGHEIPENEAINSLLARIDKNQGHRRFKTANFKGKSSLFQNQHLQIGYKSEAIYEQISGFRVLLKIQLFFGNLGDSNIRNLSSEFKGDQNILLYANPRSLDTTIVKGQQNKIQLIIIPLKPQFPLLTAQVRYEVEAGMQQFQIIVPNSALKFAHFMEVPRDEFLSRWSSAQLYKTTEFQLSHYLPPDTLVRWIPSLSELVSYTTFVVPSSKKDYELFTSVLMMQKFEALLKINVRPNMNVVIQLGVQVKIDESNNYFTTFLQHLQQFMKQNK